MVLVFTVAGSTGALNVNTTLLVTGTPVAPFAGVTLVTVKDEVPERFPVVKLSVEVATGFPSTSLNPLTAAV
jgi:hypothetical protein